MGVPLKILREFSLLLTKSLDCAMDEQEMERFAQLFNEYPQLHRYYKQFVTLNMLLCNSGEYFERVKGNPVSSEELFNDLLHKLAEYEEHAPIVEVEEKPVPVEEVAVAKPKPKSKPRPVKLTRLRVVTTIAAMLLLTFLFSLAYLLPTEVATVADMMDAEITGETTLVSGGRLLDDSAVYHLHQGILKLTFDNGVTTVLEGPAQFALTSPSRMALMSGRLCSHVPESGKGFRVDTPESSIIDLGTEYAVEVQSDLSSEVHMFQGKALINYEDQNKKDTDHVLTQGQARRVNVAGNISEIAVQHNEFIRNFNSKTKTLWRGELLQVGSMPAENTDAYSGIDPAKHYTHLLDFGDANGPTVVNGVEFFTDDLGVEITYSDPVYRNTDQRFTIQRSGGEVFRRDSNRNALLDADGGMSRLLTGFVYHHFSSPEDHYSLVLTGLTPGQKYSFRCYYCSYFREGSRSNKVILKGQKNAREIEIDQQAGGAHFLRYDYTAYDTTLTLTFKSEVDNKSWHLYGLSNEIVDVGQ